MAISYSWNVGTVDDSEGRPWTAEVYGNQSLDVSDLSSFTAFASLDAAKVQGWVEASLTADTVTDMKSGLDAEIAAKITPKSVTKTIG